jgi:hypothetical protein
MMINKSSIGHILPSIALCLMIGVQGAVIPAIAKTIKPHKSMNKSEITLIENVQNACTALALQANDTKGIASKFGTPIDQGLNEYEIRPPFNKDLDTIFLSTDQTGSTLPYPAYMLNFRLKAEAPISIASLKQAFGSYQEIPQRTYYTPETIAFSFQSPKIKLNHCRILVEYKSAVSGLDNARIIGINVLTEK